VVVFHIQGLRSVRRFLEESDQLADGAVAVAGVPKGKLFVDDVRIPTPVPTPVPGLRHVARLFEVAYGLRYCALRDPDSRRNVFQADRWIGGDHHENVRMVRQEAPRM
jgi:hypothetical protein